MKTNWWRILGVGPTHGGLRGTGGDHPLGGVANRRTRRGGAGPATGRCGAILMGLAEFLSRSQRFNLNVRSSYDAVQPSGQKIEFGDSRTPARSHACRGRAWCS